MGMSEWRAQAAVDEYIAVVNRLVALGLPLLLFYSIYREQLTGDMTGIYLTVIVGLAFAMWNLGINGIVQG